MTGQHRDLIIALAAHHKLPTIGGQDTRRDRPVQQPIKFESSSNVKTTKALRLEIRPGVLAIADEVIE